MVMYSHFQCNVGTDVMVVDEVNVRPETTENDDILFRKQI